MFLLCGRAHDPIGIAEVYIEFFLPFFGLLRKQSCYAGPSFVTSQFSLAPNLSLGEASPSRDKSADLSPAAQSVANISPATKYDVLLGPALLADDVPRTLYDSSAGLTPAAHPAERARYDASLGLPEAWNKLCRSSPVGAHESDDSNDDADIVGLTTVHAVNSPRLTPALVRSGPRGNLEGVSSHEPASKWHPTRGLLRAVATLEVDVLGLIRTYSLVDVLTRHIRMLLAAAPDDTLVTVALLHDKLDLSTIVGSIQSRSQLFFLLHALTVLNPAITESFHQELLSLYIEFEPQLVLGFVSNKRVQLKDMAAACAGCRGCRSVSTVRSSPRTRKPAAGSAAHLTTSRVRCCVRRGAHFLARGRR